LGFLWLSFETRKTKGGRRRLMTERTERQSEEVTAGLEAVRESEDGKRHFTTRLQLRGRQKKKKKKKKRDAAYVPLV